MNTERSRDRAFSVRIENLLPVVALVGIYMTSFYSYLLFHSLAEVFSAAVACGIFMLAWNSRRFLDNNYLLFLGIAYLFVAGLDLVHTLAYSGMGVFPGYGANLPTQLWIAARFLESLSLVAAPFFLGRRLKVGLAFGGYVLVVSLALASIFGGVFPDCFIEGQGLTPFKKLSEYAICGILVGAAALLFRSRSRFDPRVLRWLLLSIAVTIASELAFTLYASPYGPANLIGHLLKIVSFYLIYKAIIVTGLREPYNLLFRELKQSEEALRASEGRYRSLSENLEETVREKVEELRQAESLASLGRMISVVAHELKNPLQNIRMGVEELRREVGRDTLSREIFEDIDFGMRMLDGIVKELLEYARPVKLEYTSWSVRELVDQALQTARHKLDGISTRLELDARDTQISVDSVKFTRVLVNLIANAAEAMPQGGTLTIASRFSEDDGPPALKLIITDTGCGMDEETLARVYEPFFTTKSQGAGLGIPICKKIIEAHGGRMSICSSPGEGATAEISLPARISGTVVATGVV